VRLVVIAAALFVVAAGVRPIVAQQPQPQAQRTPRAVAPVDLTGYWVSVVTEDWIERMVTPAKGDYGGVPLNPRGVEVANTWDPAKDEASGNQCKAYGAAGLMRQPGRIRIIWADDNTLQIETDAGMQKRLLNLGPSKPPSGVPQWQGYSVASWLGQGPGAGRGPAQRTSLKVVTTRMRPGYLRLNGVPYSANAVVTEYFDRSPPPAADWLIVQTIVEDPEYLTESFVTSTHFKREPDGAKWNPTPCEATRAVRAQ
jgi:hypothetical protein